MYDACITYARFTYIYAQACIYSSESRQEEPCDTGVTLSNSGSICCLHPAAFRYFLSPYVIIVLTSSEKVLAKITKRYVFFIEKVSPIFP